MSRHLYYFRPGEESRMLARCQLELSEGYGCGAIFTYPIKGCPWRRNVVRSYEFDITDDISEMLFSEVNRIRRDYPEECLDNEMLFSDFSEKANAITRDRETRTLCYTIGVYLEDGSKEDYYALRENSKALLSSDLFKTVSKWIEPYEQL